MGTLDISARSFGQSLFSIDQTSTHLKAATELIERERQAALQKSDAYASKLHDTQTYVQRLEHAYSDVVSRNAQLRTIYSKNQDAVTSLNSHYEASKQLLEQLKGDVNWLRSELKKADADRAIIITAQKESEKHAVDLERALEVASSEKQGLLSEVASTETICRELETKLSLSEADKTKKCTNLQNRIIALSAELQASEESLTAARTSAHQAKASLAAATLQHHQISHELEEKLNAVTSAKEAAHQQLVEQTERTNELQADVLRLMEAEVELQRVQDKLAAELKETEETLQGLEQEKAALQEKLANAATELKEATAKATTLATELAEAEEEHVAAQAKHAAQLADLTHAHATAVSDLQVELAAAKKATSEAVEASKQAQADAQRKMEENRDLILKELENMGEVHKAELSTVTEERDALKATAQEATERAIVLDKEVATLQLKLDDAKRGWSQCEDKLNEQIAALQAAHEELRAKDDQLQATADAADRLQQEVASVHESLQEKEALLHSIHAVSKQAAGLADGHLPAKRTRTAQTIPQQLHVRFDDTVHVTEAGSGSEDEWGEEEDVHGAGDPYEDEEQEVAEEDALAVVVHRPAPKQRGPAPRAFGRPVRGAKPVGGSVTAPMVEEPSDSDDDDDEHAEMSRQVVQQGRGRRGGGAEVPAAGGRGMRMASMMGQKRTGIARMPRGGAKGASVPQRAMGRAHPQPKAKGSRMAGPPVVAKATKVKGLPAPGLFSLFNHLNHASPGST